MFSLTLRASSTGPASGEQHRGGLYDSSKTRVAPVFDQLRIHRGDWVRELISLATCGSSNAVSQSQGDLTFIDGYWGEEERGLNPPPSLLSWLIRNLQPPIGATSINAKRQALLARDPSVTEEALRLLDGEKNSRAWYIFEGLTFPDALLVTPDALVVVEGKRTEPGPTTATTWLQGRHQIWRHIEAAWEIREARRVYGLFIVEGNGSADVPELWKAAMRDATSPAVLASSFPHRTTEERQALANCMLGVTTWQCVCATFGIDYSKLPDKVSDIQRAREL